MNLVVAVDNNWGIGYKGDLLARVSCDLKHFREITAGNTVVYGSNTLATFPKGRVLPKRTNIVLHPDPEYKPEGAIVVHSLDELFEELKKYDTDTVSVIGGASVYNQLLPYCNKAYITKFLHTFESDVRIPNLDELPEWEITDEGEAFKPEDADFEIKYVTYEKK